MAVDLLFPDLAPEFHAVAPFQPDQRIADDVGIADVPAGGVVADAGDSDAVDGAAELDIGEQRGAGGPLQPQVRIPVLAELFGSARIAVAVERRREGVDQPGRDGPVIADAGLPAGHLLEACPGERAAGAFGIERIPDTALIGEDAGALAPGERTAQLVRIGESVIAFDRQLGLVKPGIIGSGGGGVVGEAARNHGLIALAVDLDDLLGDAAELALRNDVPDEGIGHPFPAHLPERFGIEDLALDDVAAERVLAEDLAGQQLAEIAVQEFGYRHGDPIALTQRVIRHGVLLERAEHKGAVAAAVQLGDDYRAAGADAAEELPVARAHVAGIVGRLAEAPVVHPRVGIEGLISQIVERAPMRLIRAGLEREIEDAAGGMAVFGRHAAGLHAEFLHGLQGRAGLPDMALDLRRGGDAVDQDLFAEGGAAGDVGGPVVAFDGGRERIREVLHGPAAAEGQRQILDGLTLHGGGNLGRVHL